MSDENKNQPLDNQQTDYSEKDYQNLLNSVSPWKIAIPIILGLGVVVYMFLTKFKAEEFAKISFQTHTYFWILMAGVFVCIRHLCYMTRLRIITEGHFSWWKCFELIVIWEFSSCITPSSVGGSAVSMFVISQEKGMTAPRTVMIILYTVVIDTFFFLTALLLFFLTFGPIMIYPGLTDISNIFGNVWTSAFAVAYLFMLSYGSLICYGVLVNAGAMRAILNFLGKLPLINRFKDTLANFGNDMVTASAELKGKGWKFHVGSILATMGAWMSRFMILNCLILAFVTFSDSPEVKNHYDSLFTAANGLELNVVEQQFFIYAREQAMYVLMAVSPTPGAAGAAELAFLSFHNDYMPDEKTNVTLATIIATVWRMFTFYSYLLFGAIVVPRWVSSVIATRNANAAGSPEKTA